MSGSYDKPPGASGRPHYPAPAGVPQGGPAGDPYDPFDDQGPVTGPPPGAPGPYQRGEAAPGQGDAYGYSEPRTAEPAPRPTLEAGRREDMYAPTRESSSGKERAKAPIVPAGSVTGRSLTLVISIMCFLACLTAGAVYMINQSADAWLKDIASEVTVQIEPSEKGDTDKTIKDVIGYLSGQGGIASVRALSVEDSAELLEPWLGHPDALKALPVPRLLAVELDRSAPPDLDAVSAEIAKQFQGVSLDDHRRWQHQIRTVTRSFALGGLAILLLVAAATTAIIVSATKSAMASNREIVEVLHFVGATDRFISHEFEKHFLRLGIRAGLVGAVSAMLVFFMVPMAMELLGGGQEAVIEMQRMIGTGALDIPGYLLLALIVIVVAALCMLTSRFGVFRILHARH